MRLENELGSSFFHFTYCYWSKSTREMNGRTKHIITSKGSLLFVEPSPENRKKRQGALFAAYQRTLACYIFLPECSTRSLDTTHLNTNFTFRKSVSMHLLKFIHQITASYSHLCNCVWLQYQKEYFPWLVLIWIILLVSCYFISEISKKLQYLLFRYKYSRTSNNGHCRGIQILSVIGGVR
jgi:hypothetical protein